MDLALRGDADVFRLANPLVATQIARRAGGGVVLPDIGVGLRPVGIEGSTVGRSVRGKVFYPNAATDTDLVVAPTATGLELYGHLRSKLSPERLRYRVELPRGARLRPDRRGGGFEVVRGGRRLAWLAPPQAWDADRRPVPASYVRQGDVLVLRVEHRDIGARYPVVADPAVIEDFRSWRANANMDYSGWNYEPDPANKIKVSFGAGSLGRGLYLFNRSTTQAYSAGDSRRWFFNVLGFGDAYIYRADFTDMYHTASNSCTTEGIFSRSGSAYESGAFAEQCVGYGDYRTHTVCARGDCAPTDASGGRSASTGNAAMFGVRMAGAATGSNFTGYVGGAAVYQYDTVKPVMATGGFPAGWVESASGLTVRGTDTGMGMRRVTVSSPAKPDWNQAQVKEPFPSCYDRKDRCAKIVETDAFTTGDLPEGVVPIRTTGLDVIGDTTTTDYQLKIDKAAPQLDFRGSTLHQGGQTMTEDSYTLNIKATDGSRARAEDQRSGVKSAEVLVRKDSDLTSGRIRDAQFTSKWSSGNQPCDHPQSSCELTRSETFRRADYAPGEYTVRVVAKDQLDHAQTKEFSFFVPPAAVEREADRIGLEQWWQYDSTETGTGARAHVNLSNGNLVWHSTPIVNVGRGLSTVMNLTYNSHRRKQLPLEETPVEQLLGPYDEAGQGFSLGVSGITRLNERLNVDLAAAGRITLTDRDGTRHVFRGEQGLASEVFAPPPGVQLHLRRFSRSSGLIDAPVFGFERLAEPDKAWAATRPDGVTYFFDQLGYQKSIEDRTGNVLRFVYDYRGMTRDACRAADRLSVNIFVLPGKVCPYKVTEVRDSSGQLDLSIAYEARSAADIPPELVPDGQEVPTVEPAGYESGRVKTITYAGRETRFNYEGGRLASTVEAASDARDTRTTAFGYEAQPSGTPLKVRPLTSVTDPRGAVTRIAYKANSNGLDSASELLAFDRPVESIVDRNESRAGGSGRQTAFTVDRSAGSALVKDTRGNDTSYRFDGRGRMTEMTDARGSKTLMAWDTDASTQTGGENTPRDITRAAGTPDASVLAMAHNGNGLLTSSTDQGAGGNRTTTLSYRDFAGLPAHRSARTDGSGASIDAGRGFVSDLLELRRPKGNTTTFSYDDAGVVKDDGLVRRQTDGEGKAVTTTYGSFGLPSNETDEVGNSTTFTAYDENGLPTEVRDPLSKAWRYRYDTVGNLLAATDPRGDGRGGAADPSAPFTTSLTYDSFDRVLTERIPKRSESSQFRTNTYAYDKNGNPERETRGATGSWVRGYSPMDELATETSPATDAAPGGEVTRQLYDDEENVVKRVSPRGMADGSDADNGFATEFRYDAVSQRTAAIRHSTYGTQGGRSEAATLATSWAYDLRGNVVGLSDAAHNEAAGGLPEANVAVESRRRFTYAYDKADNRVAEVEDPGGEALTKTFGFDANDNPTSVTDPRSNTTSYRYDRRDLRTDAIDALGKRTHTGLRDDGKVAFEVSPRGTAGIAEDAAPASYDSFRTNYTYDGNGELIRQSIPKAPNQYGGLERDIAWTRNEVGDPTTITDARGNAFTNTFYDTGELRSTERPSWWKFAPSGGETPELQERGWEEMIRSTGDKPALPKSEGEGDFGAVNPVKRPDLLPRAGATSFDYDDEMRLTQVTDAATTETVLGRDELGRVTKLQQPFDASQAGGPSNGANRYLTRELSYDRNGNLNAEIDRAAWRRPDGTEGDLRTDLTYDQYDRLVVRDEPGADGASREVTDLTLDANDNTVKRDTPRGSLAWEFGFDSLDRMTFGENPANERTGYGYDRAGNRTSETSPRGMAKPAGERGPFTTARVFGARDELATATNGLGHETRYGYDADGNQDSVDAPGADNRILTRRTFDGRGLQWSETVGTGEQQRTTVTEHDPNGNLRRQVNPAGVDEQTKRPKDAWDGDAVSATATDNATVNQHTPSNLLSASWLPTGDLDGTGDAPADTRRFRQDFGYDSRGRVETVSSPYRPDLSCPPASEQPNEGCTSTVRYTNFDSGWTKTQSDPELRRPGAAVPDYDQMLAYDYDRRGNQVTWRTPRGQTDKRVMTRHYAPNGTLTQRIASDSYQGAPRSYRFTYNPNHSRTSMRDEQLKRTTRIGYDDAERPVTVDETWDPKPPTDEDQRGDASRDVAFDYDADGNTTERRTEGNLATSGDPITYVGGKTTGFVYDTIGRETDMLVCTGGPGSCLLGSADRKTTTDYYPSDAVRQRTKPNGVVETLTFNDDGRLGRMKRNKGSATGAELKNQPYSYDPNGNRSTDERGAHRFNPRDQLVHWTRGTKTKSPGSTVAYELNGSGAIKQKVDSATPGGATTTKFDYLGANGDRLEKVEASQPGATSSSATYSYDEFGAVELIDPDVGESTSYDYDEFGRMTKSRGPGLEGDKDFGYDALDRRDMRIEDPDTPAIKKFLDYSYVGLGEELSREELPAGKVKTFDYDSQLQRQGQTTKPTAATPGSYRSYGKDANGSVEGLEDADGDIRECGASEPTCRSDRYRYDPYGEMEDTEADLSEEAKDNPFRFEGHYYDAGLKSYDMRARPYRPDIGRFITQDRFEASTGDINLQSDALTQNRYAFAGGNPVNNIEFDGHYASTGDESSRHIQVMGGDSYDRSTGKRTSGPNKGSGPGGSGYVDRTNSGASSKPYLARRIAKLPAATAVIGGSGRDPAALQRMSAGHLLDLYADVETEQFRSHAASTENPNPASPLEVAALIVNPCKAAVALCRAAARPVIAAGKKVLAVGSKRLGPLANKILGGSAAKGAGGIAESARLGRAGEAAAGITKNTQRIPSATGPPGRYRVPDVYDPRAGVLGEVKNVRYQSYSSQLRDYAAIAQRERLAFELTVRGSTRLSGPLQRAEALGEVRILRDLP